MMESVRASGDGLPVGVYRDEEDRVPVLLRTPIRRWNSHTANRKY